MSKSTIYYIENKNLKKVGMQNIIKDFMMKRLEYFLGKDIILNDFIKYENSNSGFRQYLRDNNLDTELILVFQKK